MRNSRGFLSLATLAATAVRAFVAPGVPVSTMHSIKPQTTRLGHGVSLFLSGLFGEQADPGRVNVTTSPSVVSPLHVLCTIWISNFSLFSPMNDSDVDIILILDMRRSGKYMWISPKALWIEERARHWTLYVDYATLKQSKWSPPFFQSQSTSRPGFESFPKFPVRPIIWMLPMSIRWIKSIAYWPNTWNSRCVKA